MTDLGVTPKKKIPLSEFVFDSFERGGVVRGIALDADESPPRADARNAGRAASHERVTDDAVGWREVPDHAPHELQRFLRWVSGIGIIFPECCAGCIIGRDVVQDP